MPLNVRKLFILVLLVLFSFNIFSYAQTANQSASTPQLLPTDGPTSAEVMRMRISKVKANIAVRNYPAALYELESISRETSDSAVNAVVNGLIMNVYLEQGDYKKANDFLVRFYDSYRSNNAFAAEYYSAVAGQVIRGSRNKADRYRAFGLQVSDRNLPLEAVNDIEQMRQIVETVITQSKELKTDKAKALTAVGLIEEATTARSILARDDYDAKRWRDAIAESREDIASSQSKIINAVQEVPPATTPENQVASLEKPLPAAVEPKPEPAVQKTVEATPEKTVEKTLVITPTKTTAAEPEKLVEKTAIVTPAKKPTRDRVIPESKPTTTDKPKVEVETGPLDIGVSLVGYATERAQPRYPATARSMRTEGVVKVEVLIAEDGSVEEVKDVSGPTLLQPAASDAIKKWRFRPFLRDGDPVKATGFINFNFTL